MEYETLKQELKVVSEKSPFGAHGKVAKKVGISEKYSQKIRLSDGAKMPTDDNKSLIGKMIKEYRKINNKELQRLMA